MHTVASFLSTRLSSLINLLLYPTDHQASSSSGRSWVRELTILSQRQHLLNSGAKENIPKILRFNTEQGQIMAWQEIHVWQGMTSFFETDTQVRGARLAAEAVLRIGASLRLHVVTEAVPSRYQCRGWVEAIEIHETQVRDARIVSTWDRGWPVGLLLVVEGRSEHVSRPHCTPVCLVVVVKCSDRQSIDHLGVRIRSVHGRKHFHMGFFFRLRDGELLVVHQ